MSTGRRLPDDPLQFIQRCLLERKVYWTYHVNMRLAGRYISRDEIFGAVDTYTIVEAYPDDKYLPSYLLLATSPGEPFHVLFAADVEGDNVRVVTAYHPGAEEWEPDLRTRRGKS
ncbi:MAG: hypothetical protein AUH43_14600 [Acidobacteria bacterium 13_1_40CM_65_14]|jgi:hypothetical protein|nr:MAG: hypothetical protein AUH43_14600 [Acidobacteria bacterium 13_1_40CM_65_14]